MPCRMNVPAPHPTRLDQAGTHPVVLACGSPQYAPLPRVRAVRCTKVYGFRIAVGQPR